MERAAGAAWLGQPWGERDRDGLVSDSEIGPSLVDPRHPAVGVGAGIRGIDVITLGYAASIAAHLLLNRHLF